MKRWQPDQKFGPVAVKMNQDSRYGVGIRVHTVGGKANSPSFRCTVCGKEKSSEVKLVAKDKEKGKDKKKEKKK